MTFKHLQWFVAAIACVALAMAGLACSSQSIVALPPTVTAFVFETATTAPQPTSVPATPTSSPTPVPATPVLSTQTAVPSPLPTASVTATAAPTGTTKQLTSIRAGPSVDYAILGNLAAGLGVKLVGRTADKTWWQIDFPPAPAGRGWVYSGNIALGATANTEALPIASAPPLPTRVPVLATATTGPGLIPVLRADKAQLSIGECTTLRWDVENVKEVWLNSGSGENPVVGHDTLYICPDETFTYTLRVVNKDNSTLHYAFAVAVTGCGADPVVALFKASHTEAQVGTKVTVEWAVFCAQSVSIKIGNGQKLPAVGRDSAEFQLNETTVFRLIIVGKDNKSQTKEITIKAVP
jgi:uncharacterized protein YgiM (DUF1202 family)